LRVSEADHLLLYPPNFVGLTAPQPQETPSRIPAYPAKRESRVRDQLRCCFAGAQKIIATCVSVGRWRRGSSSSLDCPAIQDSPFTHKQFQASFTARPRNGSRCRFVFFATQ